MSKLQKLTLPNAANLASRFFRISSLGSAGGVGPLFRFQLMQY